jgi:hypothetical protein
MTRCAMNRHALLFNHHVGTGENRRENARSGYWAASRRPDLSTCLKDHIERRLGSAAEARKTRLGRDLTQSTLAGLCT